MSNLLSFNGKKKISHLQKFFLTIILTFLFPIRCDVTLTSCIDLKILELTNGTELEFQKICNINPRRNGYTWEMEYRGSFCDFRIPTLAHWSQDMVKGVYAIFQDGKPVYVGKTGNLATRFNRNYARSWKKNNASRHDTEINKKILETTEAGHLIELYFHNVSDELKRDEVETDLIHHYDPSWNILGRPNESQDSAWGNDNRPIIYGRRYIARKGLTDEERQILKNWNKKHSTSSDKNSKKHEEHQKPSKYDRDPSW